VSLVSEPPLVDARGLSKHWGDTAALRDASIVVRRNETHALVGRNGAGKSTLVSLLTGLFPATAGSILFGGESAPALDDRQAWMQRVACVYQRPTVVPHLSVAENLLLNALPERRPGVIDWRQAYESAQTELAQWGIDVDPRLSAVELSVEQRQLVEIARALRRGSRFVILDEPTAQLDGPEIRRLFDRIRALQDAGVSFLFISHHLDEVFELCSEVTVLRDGRVVHSGSVSETPMPDLVSHMIGTTASSANPVARRATVAAPRPKNHAVPVLQVSGLHVAGLVSDITLEVRAGECVGLAGQSSSGKSLVGDAIFGLAPVSAGSVELKGRSLVGLSTAERIRAGVGYVPEDRHDRGFVPAFGVEENATLSVLRRVSNAMGIMLSARRRWISDRLTRSLDIKATPSQAVVDLSGGNQQKVVMARALAADPALLVLIKPTVGVDIASKNTLYGFISQKRDEGIAVLLISDELDELELCDRVLVMSHGSLLCEFGADRSSDELIAAMEGSHTYD